MSFIEIIEKNLGMKCKKNLIPIHPGDAIATYAHLKKLIDVI
jgi:hypothetical protein